MFDLEETLAGLQDSARDWAQNVEDSIDEALSGASESVSGLGDTATTISGDVRDTSRNIAQTSQSTADTVGALATIAKWGAIAFIVFIVGVVLVAAIVTLFFVGGVWIRNGSAFLEFLKDGSMAVLK